MNKEELRQQCEALSDQELFLVVNNKGLYNEMIVTAAQIELRKRSVSKEDVKRFRKASERLNNVVSGDIVTDCSFFQKFYFYFLWFIRVNSWVMRDFRRQGSVPSGDGQAGRARWRPSRAVILD